MVTILLVGFLIGMQHAIEPDHLAAVAALTTRGRSTSHVIRQGAAWGIGHGLTLLVFGGLVLLLDAAVPAPVTEALELAVAFMLILLGADVLRKLWRDFLPVQDSCESDIVHRPAHNPRCGIDYSLDSHTHSHIRSLPLRAMLVGMMHGLAGSAALVVLAVKAVATPLQGLLYILLFGAGSIVGMATLAAVICLPLRYSAGSLTWAHNIMQLLIGALTIGLGTLIACQIAFQLVG